MSDSPYVHLPDQTPSTDSPVGPGSNGAAVHPQALTDRMAQGAHHTIDRWAETAAPHVDRLEEAVSGASARLKDQAQRTRDTGDEWADGLRTTVRRNPLTALAAALAIGALISRMTR